MATRRRRLAAGLARPVRLWHSSLALRLVVGLVAVSGLLLVLGGMLIMRQASNELLESKRRSAVAEAGSTLGRMQSQLSATDLQQATLYERLSQITEQAGSEPELFWVVVEGPVSVYASGGVGLDSVPVALRTLASSASGMWVTPTSIHHIDGHEDAPGLVVASSVVSPTGLRVPVYFVFPQSYEAQTLEVLRRALMSAGAVLLVFFALFAWFTARRVTIPMRAMSRTAERIAGGLLSERVTISGTDELARLGRSMNHMAGQLDKQITELEKLSRLQQRFVSDVSHELRTPLTTMKMASEVLYEVREGFDPASTRTVELLNHEVERFEKLLADLLEISRFDAGAAQLVLEETDVAELVDREVRAQEQLAQRLHSEIHIHSDGPERAEIDSRRVARIVRNLLTNALEYGEGEPIDVTVAGDQHAVAVRVHDHGVGLLPKQTQKVFNRFWRADPSRQRSVGGTGLGLSISLEDARLHHGWLQAWGRPGRGSVFRLTLPRRPDDPLRSSPLPLGPGHRATDDLGEARAS
ncbi:two-component system, OmpR family, sensor histidine kinase MtrB [Propionibacterium cyclohexanicum]|uniref:Sensor histidine kinase MtrB n=1 Tax=Propionibacterium cyclohexanicum TaxID=64702 RepID=A0A1H9RA52_9ACTN|nr:MtrAB system histidine kinase MtrB [Propionibacterium cyclohexanicum]SER69560.1 two-component system, OmpR family, sensor histidine kinase MtrB [Propionibacterium cyclohexanicum]